ncbi:hypothetical protein HUK80_17430 [Flavobacterium sp. MAH-1]|uniref:Uncharacterized protein n=1 Tax=Flavobacterium agri TaxID=2743471 RepID=A0A7Y8Y5A6_9FLAO|nr:hypothetical protein [Flavobacterium agri]NUY82688.1 hypothetical protein [Flavobacterium agri]NYA72711.1 hypothetical protein [Flavobacterium agri]
MTKFVFPIITISLIAINILFIGILKTNEVGISELFIKSQPTTELIFLSDQYQNTKSEIYYELILKRNIQDQEKSLLPLFLIQLMISSFAISFASLDLKRKGLIFLLHCFLMGILSVFIIPLILPIDNLSIAIAALVIWVAVNFGFLYILKR